VKAVTQELHNVQDSRGNYYGQGTFKERVKSNTQQNFSGKMNLKVTDWESADVEDRRYKHG